VQSAQGDPTNFRNRRQNTNRIKKGAFIFLPTALKPEGEGWRPIRQIDAAVSGTYQTNNNAALGGLWVRIKAGHKTEDHSDGMGMYEMDEGGS